MPVYAVLPRSGEKDGKGLRTEGIPEVLFLLEVSVCGLAVKTVLDNWCVIL